MRKKTIAIIGGGTGGSLQATHTHRVYIHQISYIVAIPKGVVAARSLRDAGHSPTIFEASGHLGGIWSPAPLNKVISGRLPLWRLI